MPQLAAPNAVARPPVPGDDAVVVRVGDRAYNRQHFRLKAELESLYLGTALDPSATAGQVLETALMRALLEQRGVTITDAMLEAEEARVDRETMDPEKLARIKALFGTDRGLYRRVFLEPILVNQKLYDFLQGSNETQGDRRKLAGALHQSAVREPARFREQVARAGGQLVVQTWKPEDRYTPQERAHYGADVPVMDGALVTSCLASLPVGQVCPAIGEDRAALKVIRLVARRPGEYDIEAGIIRKRTFEEWFPVAVQKLSVEWHDVSFRDALGARPALAVGGHP